MTSDLANKMSLTEFGRLDMMIEAAFDALLRRIVKADPFGAHDHNFIDASLIPPANTGPNVEPPPATDLNIQERTDIDDNQFSPASSAFAETTNPHLARIRFDHLGNVCLDNLLQIDHGMQVAIMG